MEEGVQHVDSFSAEDNLVRASQGKRLANYLIDLVVFYICVFIFGIVIALVYPSLIAYFQDESPAVGLLDRVVSLVLYAVFMSLVEAAFEGRSIGKFITGTKAVNLDGSQITASKAFARGFARAVPFCAFSALSTPCDPWQDRWTDTMVIDIKESKL